MTVKDLKKKLEGWPDDMPVGVYDTSKKKVAKNVDIGPFDVESDGNVYPRSIESPNCPGFCETTLVMVGKHRSFEDDTY